MLKNEILKNKRGQAGFTLFEIAAYVILSGMLFLAGLMLYKAYNTYSLDEENKRRLDVLELALNDFYISEGRYPCPASFTAGPGDLNYGVEQCRSLVDKTANPDSCVGVPTGVYCTTNFTRDADNNGNNDVVLTGAFPFTTVFDVLNPIGNPYKKSRDFSHKDGTDAYGFHLSYGGGEIIMDDKYSFQNRAPVDIMESFFVVDESNATSSPTESATGRPVFIIAHGEGGFGAYTAWGVLHKGCNFDSVSEEIKSNLSDLTDVSSKSSSPPAKGGKISKFSPPPSLFSALSLSQGGFLDENGNFSGFNPPANDPTSTLPEESENCDNEDDGIIQFSGISLANDLNFFNDQVKVVPPPVEDFWTVVGVSASGQFVANKNMTGFVGINTNQPQFDLSVDGNIEAASSIIGLEICQNADVNTCLEPRNIAGERPADNSNPAPHESAIRCDNNQVLYGIGGGQALCTDLNLVTAANTAATTNVFRLDQTTGTLSPVYNTSGQCPPGTGIRGISNRRVICTAVQGVTY
ncbi:MAG: hypothetical protein GC137_04750 [Alphaproteobacteria bacterium]|nr:hypothetical protein [Alphaproteobacteria bacterium]